MAAALVVCAPALWLVSLQVRLYLARVGYPGDVDWLEGSALYQAYRVMRLQTTYGTPALGYLPLLHPPVYPTLLGALGHVFGLGYAMARTVSMACFALTIGLIGRALLRHEAEREEPGARVEGWTAALLAAGCAAAGAPLHEAFYDLVRGDILAIALCALAAALADARRMTPRRILALALVLTAALYTRLPLVFPLVWIGLFVLARDRHAGLLLSLASISAAGLALVALLVASKGWYWMYTVSMLQGHTVTPPRLVHGLKLLVKFAPFLAALPVVALGLAALRRLSARSVLWLGMLAASVPAAVLPFAKDGGFSNDLMPIPVFAGAAALFLASDAARALARRPPVAAAARWLVFAAFAGFLVARDYNPYKFMPTAEARRRTEKLNALVAELPGSALAPRHPFLPIHNGHTNLQFSDMPYLDAVWAGYEKNLQLGRYLDRVNAPWVLITGNEVAYTMAELAQRYQVDRAIVDAPSMVVGDRAEITHLLARHDGEPDARILFDFEAQGLAGWTAGGDAFALRSDEVRYRRQPNVPGVVGDGFVSSFDPVFFDASRGTLTSPPFVIDRPRLAFRVGGGWSPRTRVELRVHDEVVRSTPSPLRFTEAMIKVVWDVQSLRGATATIALIDMDSGGWGHLNCDHFVLY